MLKKLLISLSLGLAAINVANADILPIYPAGYTVCPDVNAITVNALKGTASAPNGWSGSSAIPLNHLNDWQKMIQDINASSDGECDYFAEVGGMIVVLHKQLPSNYKLYDANYGVTPVSNCWTYYPQINAGLMKQCYFYQNSVLKK